MILANTIGGRCRNRHAPLAPLPAGESARKPEPIIESSMRERRKAFIATCNAVANMIAERERTFTEVQETMRWDYWKTNRVLTRLQGIGRIVRALPEGKGIRAWVYRSVT